MRMFENPMLRAIFGPKREEMAGEDCMLGVEKVKGKVVPVLN
jgi:hypothetical protein